MRKCVFKNGMAQSVSLSALSRELFAYAHSRMSTFFCCLCSCRMGLPVDSPDRNDDAHKYEQPGEEEGGDNQTETCTRSVLPAARKKRKCKKRYFTAGSPPYVLLQLFPTAGIFPLSTVTVMIL